MSLFQYETMLNTAWFLFMMRDESHHERHINQGNGTDSPIPRRGKEAIGLVIETKQVCYAWIRETLIRFHHRWFGRADKGLLLDLLHKVNGYSRIQA
jgi:hypothetical protein